MRVQPRVAGIAISIAVLVIESMMPQTPPLLGVPIVVVCVLALVVSLAPEQVRAFVHGLPRMGAIIPSLDKLIDWIVGIDIQERQDISAADAIKALVEARPNSYETTAINLADKARMGMLRAWGRPRPKMALPDHITSVEQIPPDIWAYAVIDTSLIHGNLPQSNMAYRRKFVKAYIEDDRLLYDAVRFNKKEVTELCREESFNGLKN